MTFTNVGGATGSVTQTETLPGKYPTLHLKKLTRRDQEAIDRIGEIKTRTLFMQISPQQNSLYSKLIPLLDRAEKVIVKLAENPQEIPQDAQATSDDFFKLAKGNEADPLVVDIFNLINKFMGGNRAEPEKEAYAPGPGGAAAAGESQELVAGNVEADLKYFADIKRLAGIAKEFIEKEVGEKLAECDRVVAETEEVLAEERAANEERLAEAERIFQQTATRTEGRVKEIEQIHKTEVGALLQTTGAQSEAIGALSQRITQDGKQHREECDALVKEKQATVQSMSQITKDGSLTAKAYESASASLIATHKTEVEGLQIQLTDKQAEIDRLKKELRLAQKELIDLRAELYSLQQRLNAAMVELSRDHGGGICSIM